MQDISIISLAVTAVLVLGCLYLALSPLFRKETYTKVMTQDQDNAQMKKTLFSTLNEIEFEYKMDKLSTADYQALKQQYESQIAAIMKEEEQLPDKKIDSDLMAEVENEINAAIKSYKQKKEEGK